jgi:hypothetical protein
MKTLKYLFVLALAVISTMSGCDLLDNAADVKFDATIEVDWVVDENGDFTNAVYSHSETLSLTSNSEIEKYKNKIKEVKVNRITYAVTDYNAEPHNTAVIFSDGVASFLQVGSSTPITSAPYSASASGVNLQTATAEADLAIDADGLSQVAAILKADKEVVMKTDGILSKTPVSFRVVSKFYVTITASALK